MPRANIDTKHRGPNYKARTPCLGIGQDERVMGGMKSLVRLADFTEAFGPHAGVLPDGLVLGSNRSDWPEVIRAVSRVGWTASWNPEGGIVELGELENQYRQHASFEVGPIPNVQVNFFLGDEVLFDIDLRELVDQVALDAVCKVVALLGVSLGKPVAISHEGDFDDVVLRYEPDLEEFTMVGAPMP